MTERTKTVLDENEGIQYTYRRTGDGIRLEVRCAEDGYQQVSTADFQNMEQLNMEQFSVANQHQQDVRAKSRQKAFEERYTAEVRAAELAEIDAFFDE